MGKRILAICCTPYQLLVAAQVLACYYPGEEADLILSDQMSGARKLWEQAQDVWPYGQVYYLEERRLNRLAHKENAKNILLGAVGMPVFSGFSAGLGVLAGPTGGYVVGYLPLAALSGLVKRLREKSSTPSRRSCPSWADRALRSTDR